MVCDKMEENLLDLIDHYTLTPNGDVRRESPRLTSWVRYMCHKHYAVIVDVLKKNGKLTVSDLINTVEMQVSRGTPQYFLTNDKLHAIRLSEEFDIVCTGNIFVLYRTTKGRRRKVKTSTFELPDVSKYACCNKDTDLALIYYASILSVASNCIQSDSCSDYISSYIRILLRRYGIYVDPFNHVEFMQRFKVFENLSVIPSRVGNYVELVSSKNKSIVRLSIQCDGIYFQIDDAWSVYYRLPILGMMTVTDRVNAALNIMTILLDYCSVHNNFGSFSVDEIYTPITDFAFDCGKAHTLKEARDLILLDDFEKRNK